MTRPDLDALEKLADEATPGEWESPAGSAVVYLGRRGGFSLHRAPDAEANAAFIAAAQPATIKALIAELKEARGHLARCVELVPVPGAIEAADAFLVRNGKGKG